MLVLIGCNSNTDYSSNELSIKEHIQNWINTAAKGDTEGYFDFITDDFIYYGPDAKPIDNLDSLRAFLGPFFENNTFSMPEWKTSEIIIRDDIAIHIFSGIAYIESKDGKSKYELDRKYIDIYRKEADGEWKCYIHTYNNN